MRTSPLDNPDDHANVVRTVYALREAAVDHGRALAHFDENASEADRDHLLDTQLALEEKTVAVIDECAENADEAVARAEG